MIEITQVQITQEQIAQNYAAALDSCNFINRINAQAAQSSDDVESITANKDHLRIMIGQGYWTDQDLEPLRLSASDVKQPYAAPIRSMAEAKAAKLAQLTQAYSTAIQQPVVYLTRTFQTDTASQQVLTASLAAGAVPTDFLWLDAVNVQVPMTFVQLQGLAGTMLAQGWTEFGRLQERKAAVRAATTVVDVYLVAW
jgi:hypothetical protein